MYLRTWYLRFYEIATPQTTNNLNITELKSKTISKKLITESNPTKVKKTNLFVELLLDNSRSNLEMKMKISQRFVFWF